MAPTTKVRAAPAPAAGTALPAVVAVETGQPVELSARDRHALLAGVMKGVARDTSRSILMNRLIAGGFTHRSAAEALDTIELQLQAKRAKFDRELQTARYKAIAQISIGIILAIVGIMVGRITSVLVCGVLVFRGIDRLKTIARQSFADVVFSNKDL